MYSRNSGKILASVEKYMDEFFPFKKLNIRKRGPEYNWVLDGDPETVFLGMFMDDRPYLVWNFNSLLQGIQLMFSMMLTDENRPIRLCKNCGKAFIARRHRDKFCSQECSEEWKEETDS